MRHSNTLLCQYFLPNTLKPYNNALNPKENEPAPIPGMHVIPIPTAQQKITQIMQVQCHLWYEL